MTTNLMGIGEKARKEPRLEFTSLYHHISDTDNLRACYEALPGNRAAGTDGVTISNTASPSTEGVHWYQTDRDGVPVTPA